MFRTHYAKVLAQCTELAQLPGWREYIWDKVQTMARECPELYIHLPAQVTAAVKEVRNGDRFD